MSQKTKKIIRIYLNKSKSYSFSYEKKISALFFKK